MPEPIKLPTSIEGEIVANKALRKNLDEQLQLLKNLPLSEERVESRKRLTEAIMWLGMDLKRLGGPNPYPESYNPANAIVDPTADNLTL